MSDAAARALRDLNERISLVLTDAEAAAVVKLLGLGITEALDSIPDAAPQVRRLASADISRCRRIIRRIEAQQ